MRGQTHPRFVIIVAASLIALCLSVLAGFSGPARAVEEGEGHEANEVVVKLDPAYRDPQTRQPATIDEINAAYGTTTKEVFLISGGIYLLGLSAGSDEVRASLGMEDDPRIVYAEPNFIAEAPEGDRYRHRAAGVSDSSVSSQYAYGALDLSGAREVSSGRGTTVAVLDTGAQLGHPALRDNFENVPKYDFVDDDPNPSDRKVGLDADGNGLQDEMTGHGTHVAGIVDVVAPKAKIMPLRVLDSEGYGNVFLIAEAISFAERRGADVINLSLGTPGHSDLLQDVIEDATEDGVVVAAAAGNANSAVPQYPAAGEGEASSADGLLAVTSVNKYEKKSGFASYGPWVDVAAPGNAIRSAFPVSEYASWSGTSMATPFVAGQAALIESVAPSTDPAGAEALIQATARPLDAKNPSYAGKLGAGHADAGASLSKLR